MLPLLHIGEHHHNNHFERLLWIFCDRMRVSLTGLSDELQSVIEPGKHLKAGCPVALGHCVFLPFVGSCPEGELVVCLAIT